MCLTLLHLRLPWLLPVSSAPSPCNRCAHRRPKIQVQPSRCRLMHRRLRAAGLLTLSRRGATVHGCSCTRALPNSHPHPKPSRCNQIRPQFPCSSPLQTRLECGRPRARSRSCIRIRPPPRLPPAPNSVFVRRGAPTHPLPAASAPRPYARCRPQCCAWAPFVVAGAHSCAILQCGARSAARRGPSRKLPCHAPLINGADGSACCCRGLVS